MNEVVGYLKDLGFTPGAYGIWSGVFMFAAWLMREWRETRKLSADDRLARREGYAKQVENLQDENRELRTDLSAAERRHDDYRRACQIETDQLRSDVRRLEDEMMGMRRKMDAQAQSIGRAILGTNAPTSAVKFAEDSE